MSKSEIEAELKSKGDFVQIDYLTRYVSEKPAFDMKKFAYLTFMKEGTCLENLPKLTDLWQI